ncbi:MAG: choice-of-anchor M domain-containing protein [Actinobacteria bacterium]|nr:choice-of-anchor M domain-containing protein [Actinomycetota bacterium]
MREIRTLRRAGWIAVAALGLSLLSVPAHAETEPPEDPNLQQSVSAGQEIVTGAKVLDAGHVDMGPKFDDGRWTLLVHDDAAKASADATSVWRYPDQTVMHVRDQSKLVIPDDPAYEFLGAAPGSEVWVVPQTQNPEVVWLGWNTQDPDVMVAIDRGVTLSLSGVQGPGEVTVYLQSGSFGEPQLLWDSRVEGSQPIWVDVNTHTHANWVFTAPGVYLMRLTAEADLVAGGTAGDTQLLRFAVGTATSTEEALAAVWEGEPMPEASAPVVSPVAPEAGPDQDPLVAGFVLVLVRGNRARAQVLDARVKDGADEGRDDG